MQVFDPFWGLVEVLKQSKLQAKPQKHVACQQKPTSNFIFGHKQILI